ATDYACESAGRGTLRETSKVGGGADEEVYQPRPTCGDSGRRPVVETHGRVRGQRASVVVVRKTEGRIHELIVLNAAHPKAVVERGEFAINLRSQIGNGTCRRE